MRLLRHLLAVYAAALLLASGCRPQEAPPPPADVVVAPADTLPAEPDDSAWEDAPEHVAPLIRQDLVDPRQMNVSTERLRVRAISDGREVAFRLQWDDDTRDDRNHPARFADACAVQMPARVGPMLPAPQMGEAGRPVQITYWSAAWQAMVGAPERSLKDLYPNATVDHYPFQAPSLKEGSPQQEAMATRYAPAHAVGNPMAGPRDKPVQEMTAEGPGTLTRVPESRCDGRGLRIEQGWSVVIRRPLPPGFDAAPQAHVAFAVWQGSRGEVGAKKMRTGWINLSKRDMP